MCPPPPSFTGTSLILRSRDAALFHDPRLPSSSGRGKWHFFHAPLLPSSSGRGRRHFFHAPLLPSSSGRGKWRLSPQSADPQSLSVDLDYVWRPGGGSRQGVRKSHKAFSVATSRRASLCAAVVPTPPQPLRSHPAFQNDRGFSTLNSRFSGFFFQNRGITALNSRFPLSPLASFYHWSKDVLLFVE